MSADTGLTHPTLQLTPEQQDLVRDALQVVDEQVNYFAPRYHGLLDRDDLASLGRLGLSEAARTFDPSTGTPFAAFARHHVQGAMMKAVAGEAAFRRLSAAAQAAADGLAADYQPDRERMSDGLVEYGERMRSFSDQVSSSMLAGLAAELSRLEGEEAIVAHETYGRILDALEQAIKSLDEKDQELLRMHYWELRDMKAVGVAMGIPYPSIRRRHQTVMGRLGARLRALGVDGPVTLGR